MITIETDVDIYISDIIDNIKYFSKSDLSELRDKIDTILLDIKTDIKEELYLFDIKTVEDEYKFKVLKEMFKNYTLEEIENLIKK